MLNSTSDENSILTDGRGGKKSLLLRMLISLIILAPIVYWIGAGQFSEALMRLGGKSLGLIFGLYCISICLRGWRAMIVQESALCRPDIAYFAIAAWHNAANQVMPFRSGEFAYPLLIKRFLGHSMTHSTASLLLIRFVEAPVLGCMVLIGMLFVLGGSGEGYGWIYFLIPLLLLMSVVWVFFPRLLGAGHHIACSAAGLGTGKWSAVLIKIAYVMQAVAEELAREKEARVHVIVLVLTILNWLVLIGVSWVVLLSLGVQVTYAEAIVGSSVASVAQFIPLGSFGNVGPLEAGWTLGFVLVGLDAKIALNAGVVLHLVMIVYSLILAGLAWVIFNWRSRAKASAHEY